MNFWIFEPIYKERVWGGTRFISDLNRKLPKGKVIGESWEIVDRPEAQSTTTEGQTLRELISADPESIMGKGWNPDKPFPILVKWLDCQDKLSLQVHPPAALASKLQGEPKTENWYIAKADSHASIMAGLKQGVSRDDFQTALKNNQLEPLVHTMNVRAGESIFIPSGRIHAIGGGNLILEIQQNSDTTYRVYDWGRVGLDGTPRELHIEESLKSTNFNDFEPKTLKPNGKNQTLAKSEVFNLRKVCLNKGDFQRFEAGTPRILSLISGHLRESDGSILSAGSNALLPAAHSFDFLAENKCELLITEDFA
jgi:mannose-6-phosphate isomerase